MKYMYIDNHTLESFIKEDIPYIDLTSELLDMKAYEGVITFVAREDGIAGCTEEVKRIFSLLDLETVTYLSSGSSFKKNDTIFHGKGHADKLHFAWKICLNLLEYSCGIATRASKLNSLAKSVNNNIEVVVTRKSMPGTKELVIKSAIAGGIYPHRLGLSETILIFDNHITFLGGVDNLISELPNIRKKSKEKKIIVEVKSYEEAMKLSLMKIDGIQFDKIPPQELTQYVKKVKEINPNIILLAAGGINLNNITDFASTGVDVIVTSSIFHGKPLDIKAHIQPL